MSEELCDEVEAINSIYGEGCLMVADDDAEHATYILKLPGDGSSLRLRFPASYPAEPPTVLGTHHSSGGRKGAGARDLGLFRDAVGSVFQEGAVCLFDAVEEFTRRGEEDGEGREGDEQGQDAAPAAAVGGEHAIVSGEDEEDEDLSSLPPPPWTLSEAITESKSTFIAHVARITSTAQAQLYVRQLLNSDKRIRSATHNVTAWRVRGPDGGATSFQDCDDDGETAAGGRLLHLLQVMEVWDVLVVVTRWYGGVKLGPRRFALINGVARDGLVRAGLVGEGRERKRGR